MPSDRLLGKHTLLHCYCRGVFYQKSAAGSLLLVPGHHHRSQHHHVTTPQHHHATLHPFNNKKTAPRGQCNMIALLPQRAVYIIIYYLFKEPYFLTFARTSFISCITGMFRNASPYTVSSCGRPSD